MALWTLWSHLLFRSRHYMCCFPDNSHIFAMFPWISLVLCERELSVFEMWFHPWPFFLLLWSTLETWKGQRPSPNWAKMQDARSEWSRATSLFQSSRGWDMDDGILWSASLTVAFFFRQRIYPVLSFTSSGKARKYVTNRIEKHLYLFIALSMIFQRPVYLKIERLSITILITRVLYCGFVLENPELRLNSSRVLDMRFVHTMCYTVSLLETDGSGNYIRACPGPKSRSLVRVSSCGFS